VEVGDGRQPLPAERPEIGGSVRGAFTVAHVVAGVAEREAGAGPERLEDQRHRPQRGQCLQRRRGAERERVAVDEDLGVGRRKPEASRGRIGRVGHDLEVAVHRAVLEPLSNRPLRGAGQRGELSRRRRAGVDQGLVQPQPQSDRHCRQLECPGRGGADLLDEGIALLDVSRGRLGNHGQTLLTARPRIGPSQWPDTREVIPLEVRRRMTQPSSSGAFRRAAGACGGSGPAVTATATDSPDGGPGASSAVVVRES
jgi:hypothetical protein